MTQIPVIHIGKAIESRLNELGVSKSDFARSIETSRQNVNRILNRESVETSVLQRFSEALDFNFFSLYCPPTESYTNTGANGIVAKNIQSIDNRQTQCRHSGETDQDGSNQTSGCPPEAKHLIEKLTLENEMLHRLLTDKERIISLYERGIVLPGSFPSDTDDNSRN